jgi:PST family polysaccharide transporter
LKSAFNIVATVKRARRSTLVHNIVSLYGMQIAAYAFPLVTIPYLARVLGAYSWGLVAIAQATGTYVGLVIEFGFNLSATRDVSQSRDDVGRLSEILAGVLGAKLVLTSVLAVGVFAIQPWFPSFRDNRLLLWSGFAMGAAQAFSMAWLYQGLERMRTSASIEVGSRALGIIGIFLLVHSQAHAWRVLAIQAAAMFLGTSILIVMAYREIPFRFPSLRESRNSLREGSSMFLLRSAVSLYTTVDVLILGYFAPPVLVGYYSGAERLTRAPLGLLGPIGQSTYPRLAHLVSHSQARAAKLARITFVCMGLLALLAGVVQFFAAPLEVRVLLGPEFSPAIPVLRVMGVLLPAVALNNVLGIQWMLPLRMDKECNIVLIGAAVLNVGLACLLAPRFNALGVAIAVVIAECSITIVLYLFLSARKLNPLHMTDSHQSSARQAEQCAAS